MKYLSILISIFLILNTALGQKQPAEISFVAYWAVGDSYDFKVTKIKQQWKGETLTKNDTSQYLANFKVIDSTATSYTIKWTYKNSLKSFDIPENMLKNPSKYSMTEIIYTTSELGEFTGIQNWEEIRDIMSNLFEDLLNNFDEKGGNKDKEGFKRAMKPFFDIFQTKQGVEQYLCPELQFFHFPFGRAYSTKKTIKYVEQLPNMFGGDPIKGNAKLFFKDIDEEEHTCTLLNQMNVDPKESKKIILQVFEKMGLKDEKFQKALKTAKFEIMDNRSFNFYYYPGIPIEINSVRTSHIDIDKEKGKRIDKISIQLVR